MKDPARERAGLRGAGARERGRGDERTGVLGWEGGERERARVCCARVAALVASEAGRRNQLAAIGRRERAEAAGGARMVVRVFWTLPLRLCSPQLRFPSPPGVAAPVCNPRRQGWKWTATIDSSRARFLAQACRVVVTEAGAPPAPSHHDAHSHARTTRTPAAPQKYKESGNRDDVPYARSRWFGGKSCRSALGVQAAAVGQASACCCCGCPARGGRFSFALSLHADTRSHDHTKKKKTAPRLDDEGPPMVKRP
jgi:hypothetical protein